MHIAVRHVLRRLLVPRHPPHTLSSFFAIDLIAGPAPEGTRQPLRSESHPATLASYLLESVRCPFDTARRFGSRRPHRSPLRRLATDAESSFAADRPTEVGRPTWSSLPLWAREDRCKLHVNLSRTDRSRPATCSWPCSPRIEMHDQQGGSTTANDVVRGVGVYRDRCHIDHIVQVVKELTRSRANARYAFAGERAGR